jgi:hypothetical protein
MNHRKYLIGLASATLFVASPWLFAQADVDCAECHDEPPISAEHMEMDEVSVEACTMCHEADASDPFFTTLHNQHGEDLGCDSCHSDDIDARKAKLSDMLGG